MRLRPLVAAAIAVALGAGGRTQSLTGDCPVTGPNRHAPPVGTTSPAGPSDRWHGNTRVGTWLWPAGRVVFEPGGSGFVLPDGALRMKFPWFKTPGTTLTITGHRYDDRSVALRVEMPRGFESQDVQPTNLVFPTAGCWVVEVTAGGDTLSFVTEAVKIGDGPTRAAAN